MTLKNVLQVRVLEKDLLLTKWSDSLEELLATQLEKDLEDAKSGEVNVVLNEFGVPVYTRCVAKYGLEVRIGRGTVKLLRQSYMTYLLHTW